MSTKVSSWVWHEARHADGSELAGNDLVLMLALADVSDDAGRAKYVDADAGLTYEALATKVRVSKRTIVRMVAALRESGLIDQVKGVKGRANEFRVMVPWAAKSGDNLAPNEDQAAEDSVTTGADSVTNDVAFGDTGDIHSSYPRIRDDVTTSSGVKESEGQRFAQPLCNVLSAELLANGVRHAISKSWLADARLLVDRDERDPHEAKALIEWACHDSFWRSNILSMPTFRKQYDKLRLARERAGSKSGTVDAGRQADAILRAREGDRQAIAS